MTIIRDEVFRITKGEALAIKVKAVKTPYFVAAAAHNGQAWAENPATGETRSYTLTVDDTEPDTSIMLKFLGVIDPDAAYEVTVSGDPAGDTWKRTYPSWGFPEHIRFFDFVL